MPSDQNLKLSRAPVFWLLALMLVAAPYQIGLFFQREWFYTHIFTALLLILALITRRHHLNFFAHKLDYFSLGLLLAYIGAALTAVNARAAVGETLKLLNFLAVYWLVAYGGWNRRDFRTLLGVLFWGGCGVAWAGLLAALGVWDLTGGYVEGRIYSTFQYANTLAAYLGIMLFLGLYLWSETKSWLRLCYPPALYAIVVCLIATGSRGGIAALLLASTLLIWLFPQGKRRSCLTRLVFCYALGTAGAVALLKFLAEQSISYAWGVLITGTVTAAGLSALQGALSRQHRRYILGTAVIVVIVITTVYGLKASGDNPLVRLRSVSFKLHEFQERLTYYRDGLALTTLRPVQGFGGGGWALYLRYQNYPYWVSDPHSQPVKVAVESGFSGLIFYLLWWVGLAYTAWPRLRQGDAQTAAVCAGLALLGIHSLIDFDLSYGAMGFLLWAGAGMILAVRDRPQERTSQAWVKYPIFAVAIAAALSLAVSGVSFLQAVEEEGWSTYYLQQGQISQGLAHLQLARQWDPFSAGFPALEAELYSASQQEADPGKALAAISLALRLDSTDPKIKDLAARIFAEQGQFTAAAALAEDAHSFRELTVNSYLDLAGFYELLAAKASELQRQDLARDFLLRGSQVAERYQNRLSAVPARDAALWVGGKPEVPEELRQKAAALAEKAKQQF